jgi:hypothetical protein
MNPHSEKNRPKKKTEVVIVNKILWNIKEKRDHIMLVPGSAFVYSIKLDPELHVINVDPKH